MTASIVVVQQRKGAFEIHRLAVGPSFAVDCIAYFSVDFARPFHVVTNKEVELSIIIVISPGCTCAPIVGRTGHPGSSSHFFEFSIALVMKQMISTHRSDEHVVQAIVVEIAD